ncbi:hypothetical protein V1477_002234, partial [Vespula maculifrons]
RHFLGLAEFFQRKKLTKTNVIL